MRKVSSPYPVLQAPRLRLRPFSPDESAEVKGLVGDWEVASTLVAVRYPYTEDMARRWLSRHGPGYESSGSLSFAVEERAAGTLAGFVGMGGGDTDAGMGYWFGRRHWGRGCATEAGRAVVAFGFEELGLERIAASHLSHNPRSGSVLRKLGMRHQRRRLHFVPKWESHHDKEEYAVSRGDYLAARERAPEAFRYVRLEGGDPAGPPTAGRARPRT